MSSTKVAVTRLLASSALTGLAFVAMGTAAPANAQDTGVMCTMIGPACSLSPPIVDGVDASGQDSNKDGKDGSPGQPGADVTANLQTPRTLQNSAFFSPIQLVTAGGRGGNGSNGKNALPTSADRGGNGAPGQNGGMINLIVGSALSGTTLADPNNDLVSGITLISAGGRGGDGGVSSGESSIVPTAGAAGDAGPITANISGTWSGRGAGLYVLSTGGQGGGGLYSGGNASNSSSTGINAVQGGVGKDVSVTVSGVVIGNTYGAFIVSAGGNGGTGGAVDDTEGNYGGNGGNGGIAGKVVGTLEAGATAESTVENAAAFYVASLGGAGGAGGASRTAGAGGQGGNADSATAIINGTITTTGEADTYGVLVQSLGGVGGNGGHSAAWFNPISGQGNAGGTSSSVTVTGTGASVTTGTSGSFADNSAGILAQSIGGDGGVGPDSSGWFAIGGGGGKASNGNTANVTMTDSSVTTYGFNSGGVIAQSIGGGGGKGGDANSSGLNSGYVVNLTIGGSGGGGGNAADANVALLGKSQIATNNQHSPGIEIQSIGGGGGDGGASYATTYSAYAGAAVSVGGTGGAGGDGGTVNAARSENSTGQITTTDSDSYGILGQSIGGGGGNGGASTAKSIVKGTKSFPSQSLALATGGSGGVPGSGSDVYLQSSGLVATTGGGSIGILAQSIGGGGGTAGDASAASKATGGNLNLAVSLAFGGTGGAAGNGGNVEAMNHGLVVTTGESATGVAVQSIGGGGGNGGAGDAKSETDSDFNMGDDSNASTTPPEGPQGSFAFALGSGGGAGAGGDGYNATATNTGAILTTGDSARGMLVQTIGGGGGNAGGGAASTKGLIQLALQVGGSGGDGGSTYYTGQVNATNSGTIVTFGADATGILAQSIAGGGGNGGKAGSTLGQKISDKAGGNYADGPRTATLGEIEQDFAAKGVNFIGDYNYLGTKTTGALGTINGLLGHSTVQGGLSDDDDPGDDLDDTAGSGGEDDDDNQAKQVSIKVGVGGSGGNGGSAGFVNVNNSGDIAVLGRMSDGILAQSIGGGGGKGGAASSASSTDIQGLVAVGGTGGGGGNGGEPTVTNTAPIFTMGAESAAIIAQSVGGGGGIGGATTTTTRTASGSLGGESDPVFTLAVSVGGNGGSGGIAEAATVKNSGAIETRSHDSSGIIAQSIAGGGGIVKTLASDLEGAGGSASATAPDYALPFTFGGSNGASGNSGAANVTTYLGGDIATRGDNSYGILAQSVAGGGGLALGGKPLGSTVNDFFGSGVTNGSVSGSSNPNDDGVVRVTVGSTVSTRGEGAIGVFAQSIGGGGGIAGGIAGQDFDSFNAVPTGFNQVRSAGGSGGAIVITVDNGASVTTNGGFSPGIVAQSVGGGGGRITTSNNVFMGTAGGSGQGGAITITVNGAVQVTNIGSAGIFAQSVGDANSNAPIDITIGTGGSVKVGSASTPVPAVTGATGAAGSSAIYIDHGAINFNGMVNTVTNNGTVFGYTSGVSSIAVYSIGGYTKVFNNGTMGGDVLLQNGGGQGCFTNTGSFVSGDAVQVGPCGVSNIGTIDIKGTNTGTTTITGPYSGTGNIVFDADFVGGTSDKLVINGTATIAGTITVKPSRVSNKAVTVVTATGGITLDPQLGAIDNSALFDFAAKAAPDGRSLLIQPIARLSSAATSLGANRQAVAGNLQALFDAGASFDRGFTALLGISDAAAYTRALDALSGQTLGILGAARFASSQTFFNSLDSGCANFGRNGAPSEQDNCGWARVAGRRVRQDATFDALGYTGKQGLYQLGLQRRVGNGWYLSGALGYELSQFNDDQHLGKVTGDGVFAGAQIRFHEGALNASFTADGGYGWYKTRRSIVVGATAEQAKASPKAWHVGGHARVAYEVPLGAAAYVKPLADFHAVYVNSGAFTEYGASPFNLQVRRAHQVALSGAVGLELGTRIKLGDNGFVRLFAGGQYAFLSNNDWQTTARFADLPGGPGFAVQTPAPWHLARFDAGVEVQVAPRFDFTLRYEPEVGRGYVSHAGAAKLSYQF